MGKQTGILFCPGKLTHVQKCCKMRGPVLGKSFGEILEKGKN